MSMSMEPEGEQVPGTPASNGKKSNAGGESVVDQRMVAREFINGKPSDLQGVLQLAFHLGCSVGCAKVVNTALQMDGVGGWALLVLGQCMFGLVSSFYFAGFHEMIHGTAFATMPLANLFSHIAGFAIFRGSNWYYYFHWHHHRFTNDPERDPELSGSTTDRIDPTADPTGAFRAMVLFLSGWPFGFERLPNMALHALGKPPSESWVDTDAKKAKVRLEYAFYLLGYLSLAAAGMARPASVGKALWYYWLLPHILGAGHLRYYQVAEHRGCKMGKFTDTNAWLVSRTRAQPKPESTRRKPATPCPVSYRIPLTNSRRACMQTAPSSPLSPGTTITWWIYTRLAWNMPYHQEHHAWPNVPFYLLPELHRRVVEGGKKPKSGCNPEGDDGFLWIHRVQWRQALVGLKAE